MPTIEQIRAARALLDWSQSDLAEHADLSQTGIARIENGTNKPNTQTLDKIRTAFENADIEFLGSNGVRKRTDEIRTLKGRDGFMKFMDDVYETAKIKGGEICLFNGVPSLFIKWLGEDWYKKHQARMVSIKDKFKFKIIIREGDKDTIASTFAEYRWLPETSFHEKTFYCYGDKLAFLSFEEEDVKVRILSQAEFAESFVILFNAAWDHIAKPIK